MNNRNIIIIGNGFDLNLGLKTSYNDFINSKDFDRLIELENKLAIHLKSVKEKNNWVDIENELASYSKRIKDVNFKIEYGYLKSYLMNYLNSVDLKNISKDSEAYKLIKNCPKNTAIYNFNYTNSILEILKELSEDLMKTIEHIFVHGSLKESDIIFGIEDKSGVKNEHLFLLKSYSKQFKSLGLQKKLLDCTGKLTIFGHSLGNTDHPYFSSYFYNISMMSNSRNKKVDIYYYGDEGYHNLMEQIHIMSKRNLTNFKQTNQVEFINLNSKW